MKLMVKLIAVLLTAVVILGFATQEEDIDATKIISAEQQLLRQNLEKNLGKTISDEELLEYQQIINEALQEIPNQFKNEIAGQPGFCQVGQKCNELYPEPPVYCHGQDSSDTDKAEICNRQGFWLKVK